MDASIETTESEQDDEETESVKQSYLQALEKHPNSLDNICGIGLENNVLNIGDSPIDFTKTYVKVQNKNYKKKQVYFNCFFRCNLT